MHAERAQCEWRIEERGQDLGVDCISRSIRGMRGTLPAFGEISIEEKYITYLALVYLCMKKVAGNDGPVRSIQHQRSDGDCTISWLGYPAAVVGEASV